MYNAKYVQGKYAGSLPSGKYDRMNAPGYLKSIDNGLENPKNNLAHRSWPKPDFYKKIML